VQYAQYVPPAQAQAAPQAAPQPSTQLVNDAQEIAPGTVIAVRYRVERFLGRGGFGAVYAVRHVNTGETLALKVLNPALASNTQAIERFRTEARAPVKIGTDHVVRVVDADVSPELGVPFLVMELLNGRDLGTELKRRGALPAGEVVLYLKQVARALDKAHGLGIIHRDLKPANLYLTQRDDGSPLVKILDFGIAKLTDGVSAELTQDGTIFGTPWFMAPEQAQGKASRVGPPADLWALGLIAFRLLTGRNYWTADGIAALIGQIVYEPMTPPSQIAPHLGPRFDAWFNRACNREIEQRYPSAAHQVHDLALALGVSTGANPSGPSATGAHVDPQPSALSISMQSIHGQSLQIAPQVPASLTPPAMGYTPMPTSPQLTVPPSPLGTSASISAVPASHLPAASVPIPKRSNAAPIAVGLLVAAAIAGTATLGYVIMLKRGRMADTATAATPPPLLTSAVTVAAAAPPPSATPIATEVAAPPPPAEVATAEPNEVALPEPPVTATAVAAQAPPPASTARASTTSTAASPPPVVTAAPTAKPVSTAAPKVGKVKF
jgi:serine/threonine-protein kinase